MNQFLPVFGCEKSSSFPVIVLFKPANLLFLLIQHTTTMMIIMMTIPATMTPMAHPGKGLLGEYVVIARYPELSTVTR